MGFVSHQDAVCKGGPRKGEKILMNSADRYCSVIKIAILIKLRKQNKKNDNLTHPLSMKSIRDGIIAAFTNRAFNEQTETSNPYAISEEHDIMSMCFLCIWMGNSTFASFFLLILTLVHLAGRCMEVARLLFKSISMVSGIRHYSPDELTGMVSFRRSKTSNMQRLHIFPH